VELEDEAGDRGRAAPPHPPPQTAATSPQGER
jgi:hypothetical protein